ncbi:hypothetical protein GCM10027449_21430 [Sinomonas notoginsengisoli]|uniref:hypothetical protein n=1 Tax=Sinomonas notoginsengisoli TaxID=1457311 RepID=UPI001F276F8F|nr:hypothetical protein [Sinomonas notoginsengisoli]
MSMDGKQARAVLTDEGLEQDAALLRALEGLHALRPAAVPEPSGRLALLFAEAAARSAVGEPMTAPLTVVPLTRAAALTAEAASRRAVAGARPRFIRQHRGALSIVVAVGLGLGASGVAAAVGGQAWDWQGIEHTVLNPATDQPTEKPSPDSPTPVHPADVAQEPTQPAGGIAPGMAVEDTPGQDGQTQNQKTSQDQNAQGQNAQGQDAQTYGQGRRQTSAPARSSQNSNSQGGNSQGGNTQGGNSQGGGDQGGNSQGSGR